MLTMDPSVGNEIALLSVVDLNTTGVPTTGPFIRLHKKIRLDRVSKNESALARLEGKCLDLVICAYRTAENNFRTHCLEETRLLHQFVMFLRNILSKNSLRQILGS